MIFFFIVYFKYLGLFVRPNPRIIIDLRSGHTRHPLFQQEVIHQIELSKMEIDRPGVGFFERPESVDLTDHRTGGGVNDFEAVASATQADLPVGSFPLGIPPGAVCAVEKISGCGQAANRRDHGGITE